MEAASRGQRHLSLEDVRAALAARCGLDDAELERLGHDEVAMVVPKLCLLQAVLEACEIQQLVYVPTVGSCAGVLVSSERYEKERVLERA